ncbi:hypothetical protein BC835DRAFT_1293604 [Cytidiella melzeri]|nr:hypothetical protein BC835DRAFT_1293604 [Cytidiella melzeri]
MNCLRTGDVVASDEWLHTPRVARWARLRLPTGQVARSLWTEEGRALNKIRISRNVKVDPSFAEVRYFFKLQLRDEEDEQAFAMVDIYSPPDRNLLTESSNTLWSCTRQAGDLGLCVVPITHIKSVVALVPHPPMDNLALGDFSNQVFVVEKMGLDVTQLAGVEENADFGNDEGED